jgi:hypothetical protein
VSTAEIQLALFECFSLSIFYSCFCRAAHTSKANTKRDIRWVFTVLGVVSIICAAAPVLGYEPDGIAVLLTAAISLVQFVTSYHWRNGVPQRFRSKP